MCGRTRFPGASPTERSSPGPGPLLDVGCPRSCRCKCPPCACPILIPTPASRQVDSLSCCSRPMGRVPASSVQRSPSFLSSCSRYLFSCTSRIDRICRFSACLRNEMASSLSRGSSVGRYSSIGYCTTIRAERTCCRALGSSATALRAFSNISYPCSMAWLDSLRWLTRQSWRNECHFGDPSVYQIAAFLVNVNK